MYDKSSLEIINQGKAPDIRSAFTFMGFMALPLMLFISGIITIPFFTFGDDIPFFAALLSVVVSEAAVVLISWRVVKEPFSTLFKVRKPSTKSVLSAIGIGAGLMIGLQIISVAIALLGGDLNSSYTSNMMSETVGWERWVTLLLVTPILVPIAEEFVFRGVIYNFIARGVKKNGVAIGAVFSAIVFGLSHYQGLDLTGIIVLLWTTLFGFLAVWLYRKYESIWAPIIAHGVYNGINVFFIVLASIIA